MAPGGFDTEGLSPGGFDDEDFAPGGFVDEDLAPGGFVDEDLAPGGIVDGCSSSFFISFCLAPSSPGCLSFLASS